MTNTVLRISDELYEELKEVAKEERRCINGMILYIIEKYLAKK